MQPWRAPIQRQRHSLRKQFAPFPLYHPSTARGERERCRSEGLPPLPAIVLILPHLPLQRESVAASEGLRGIAVGLTSPRCMGSKASTNHCSKTACRARHPPALELKKHLYALKRRDCRLGHHASDSPCDVGGKAGSPLSTAPPSRERHAPAASVRRESRAVVIRGPLEAAIAQHEEAGAYLSDSEARRST